DERRGRHDLMTVGRKIIEKSRPDVVDAAHEVASNSAANLLTANRAGVHKGTPEHRQKPNRLCGRPTEFKSSEIWRRGLGPRASRPLPGRNGRAGRPRSQLVGRKVPPPRRIILYKHAFVILHVPSPTQHLDVITGQRPGAAPRGRP